MISVNKRKVQGIILKNDDYKEDSTKIIILTSDGLESLIIRGSKKINSKLRSLSQILTYVELITTNNLAINTVTEGFVLNNYTRIKENTLKTFSAVGIVETLITLIESIDNIKNVYNYLIKILNILESSIFDIAVNALFHIKFLYAIGITPQFNQCVKCGNENPQYLNVYNGGFVCDACFNNKSHNQTISKLFKLIFFIKLENINDDFIKIIDENKKELYMLIKEYYITHLDFFNKSNDLMFKM